MLLRCGSQGARLRQNCPTGGSNNREEKIKRILLRQTWQQTYIHYKAHKEIQHHLKIITKHKELKLLVEKLENTNKDNSVCMVNNFLGVSDEVQLIPLTCNS